MDKKILHIDRDNALVDFPATFDQAAPELLEEYAGRGDDIPGSFSLMPPMEGAIESYGKLAAVDDTYILTTAPWANPSAWMDKLL